MEWYGAGSGGGGTNVIDLSAYNRNNLAPFLNVGDVATLSISGLSSLWWDIPLQVEPNVDQMYELDLILISSGSVSGGFMKFYPNGDVFFNFFPQDRVFGSDQNNQGSGGCLLSLFRFGSWTVLRMSGTIGYREMPGNRFYNSLKYGVLSTTNSQHAGTIAVISTATGSSSWTWFGGIHYNGSTVPISQLRASIRRIK